MKEKFLVTLILALASVPASAAEVAKKADKKIELGLAKQRLQISSAEKLEVKEKNKAKAKAEISAKELDESKFLEELEISDSAADEKSL